MSQEESTNPADYRQSWRNTYQVYAWVWRELLNDAGRTTAKRLAVCLCGKNIVAMFVPWFLGKMIGALSVRHWQEARDLFTGIIVTSGITWLFQRHEARFREVIFGENMGSINLRANELFLGKSLGQHLRENALLSSSGMEKGRNRSLESMNLLATEAIEAVFLLLASYVALWCVSSLAGLVSTSIFVVCILWSLYLNGKVAEVCAPLDGLFRRWHRHLMECWEHVERVKTNGYEEAEVASLSTSWNKVISADRKFWLWFLSHTSFRYLLCTIALFLVLDQRIEAVEQTGSGVDQIFPLFIWMRAILDNIWRLGHVEHKLGWNMPSASSLEEGLTLPPEVTNVSNAATVDASRGIELELKDVHHAYHPSKLRSLLPKEKKRRITRPVLKGVSFTVKQGERVALIGASGAGKTSIMRLIQRAFDPETGEVLVNGVDLRQLNLQSWLRCIGYIPQKASVFEGTIRFNLTYGLTEEQLANITDDFLWGLLVQLKVADRMEDGLDTLLGKGGIELSGGEAQRVMVAAALAKSPHFFLIDEATSALDSTTERAVQAAIEAALTGDVGALIIAHRLSTVRRICNKFIVLRPANDDGEPQVEAVASSFEELYRISPTFRALADDQGIAIAA